MSWSISLVGKPSSVAKAFEERASQSKCIEPEESVKNAVVDILKKLTAAMADSSVIRVEASGSQMTAYDSVTLKTLEGKFSHSFNVKIETIYGFIE